MKPFVKPKLLPWLPMLAGVIGLSLRIWLYTGLDEKGLLPDSHISNSLVFILTALVLGFLFFYVKRFSLNGSCRDCFPRSVAGGIGNLAAACAVAAISLREAATGVDGLVWVTLPMGLLAALALAGGAVCRFRGARPAFLLYAVVTLYLMLHAVTQCRIWGSEPQLLNYCFQLLASIFLMLTAYHRCAASIDRANCRWYLFTGQAALFFCCVSVNTENGLFYLAMGLWMATDLCKLQEV